MDQLRRKGTKALKERFLLITEDEEMLLVEKVKYFSDEADSIRKGWSSYFKFDSCLTFF